MTKIMWRCECGATYEVPQEQLGKQVRCPRCGAIEVIRKPPKPKPETRIPNRPQITLPAAPPPLPKSGVLSEGVSVEGSIRQGHRPGAVNEAFGKPERVWPLLWVAIIVAPCTVLLLMILLVRGGSTPQQQAEKARLPSAVSQSAESSGSVPIPDEAAAAGETDGEQTTEPDEEDIAAAARAAEQPSIPPTDKILELADLAELVGPSVVQLNVTGPEEEATGSGFVLDKQGTIVTNYHVIEDATSGTIVFSDKTIAPITGYLGVWPEKDIALVRVKCPPDKLHPLRLATSTPRQGERVAAFGSPLGLQQSVTEGIVSAVRESEELRSLGSLGPISINARLIQTTTPISHGNSGGPLVDMKGMVVGVNTMTFRSRGGENLNFAVAAVELRPLLLAKNETPSPLPANDPAGIVLRILRRAAAHITEEDYDSAIDDLTEAIRLDPENVIAYFGRAWAYHFKQDYDSAIADFTEAIRLDPESGEIYWYRGLVYESKGRQVSADRDFAQAKRLGYDPDR